MTQSATNGCAIGLNVGPKSDRFADHTIAMLNRTEGVTCNRNLLNAASINDCLTTSLILWNGKSLPQGCTSRLRRICAHLGFFLTTGETDAGVTAVLGGA